MQLALLKIGESFATKSEMAFCNDVKVSPAHLNESSQRDRYSYCGRICYGPTLSLAIHFYDIVMSMLAERA